MIIWELSSFISINSIVIHTLANYHFKKVKNQQSSWAVDVNKAFYCISIDMMVHLKRMEILFDVSIPTFQVDNST